MPSPTNLFAGAYLADRLVHLRKRADAVEDILQRGDAWVVPVWRSRSLIVRAEQQSAARFIGVAQLPPDASRELILLGEFREKCCFAWEVPGEASPTIAGEEDFHDLRLIAAELPIEEAGVLAYARALVLWRSRHRFCGRCGSPTNAEAGGHVLRCSNAACGIHQFPRIDPAIIVLVTHEERALLGRQASWPAGRYSTIAGFVEPGESLEDAVAREVREETGIVICNARYHSSQPWPFPSSMMLGFTAEATTSQIERLDDELEDARWVSREQIAAGEVALPTPVSISFRLIEDWYDAGGRRLREEPAAQLWSPPRR